MITPDKLQKQLGLLVYADGDGNSDQWGGQGTIPDEDLPF